MDKKLHPYGMLLTKSEASEYFDFMFKSIIDEVKKIFNFDYSSDTLIAHLVAAITNGLTIGFGHKPVWTCWAHALRSFDKKYKKVISILGIQIKVRAETWYEGYHPFLTVLSSNNALESVNNVIKNEETLRKRFPVAQFCNLMKNKILKKFSTERNPLIDVDGKMIESKKLY